MLIFSEPICQRDQCTHHDPNFPNNCAITTLVENCCMANVKYPNHSQRAFAWMDRHWLKLVCVLGILSLIIFWSLVIYGAGAKRAIEDMRRDYTVRMEAYERAVKPAVWKRLARKHGYPAAVIYEPGKPPYYFNARKEKCRFV